MFQAPAVPYNSGTTDKGFKLDLDHLEGPAKPSRCVAQPGSALPSGGRGRRFKSSHTDQLYL